MTDGLEGELLGVKRRIKSDSFSPRRATQLQPDGSHCLTGESLVRPWITSRPRPRLQLPTDTRPASSYRPEMALIPDRGLESRGSSSDDGFGTESSISIAGRDWMD